MFTFLICIFLLLSFVAAFVSGNARGFHHARRDYPRYDRARLWVSPDRYIGGTGTYNQSWPWTADHAHQMMHFQVLGLTLAGMFAVFASAAFSVMLVGGLLLNLVCAIALTSLVWGWAIWWIEGRGFTLTYHVILPDGPDVSSYSFNTWLLDWVRFW